MRKNIKRNKSIIIILAAILFMSTIAVESINSQQNGTILSIENITIETNKIKSAKVLVHNVDNLGSFKVSILYDTSILNVANVDNCEIDDVVKYENITLGILNITGYNFSAITTDLICIAEIQFKAVGSDGQTCDLIIKYSQLLTADPAPIQISHETSNGTATIEAGSSGGGSGGTTSNIPPIADASNSETTGFVYTTINFDGTASSDSDGTITDYTWKFGDGITGYGSTTTHIYTETGTYSVTLSVTDDDGASDDDVVQVVISQPNIPPTAPDVDGPRSGKKNTVLSYSAVSTDEDNNSIQYIFDWDDGIINTSVFVNNGTGITQSHSWSISGVYTIKVKAYDGMSESGITNYVVLIDAIWVKDIGYLIDSDGDGVTYEKFYSNETQGQTNTKQLENGSYMINSDSDDDNDWIYDPQTDTLNPYEPPSEPEEEEDSTLLYAFIIIVVIILLIIGAVVGRKPKPEEEAKPEKEPKLEIESTPEKKSKPEKESKPKKKSKSKKK